LKAGRGRVWMEKDVIPGNSPWAVMSLKYIYPLGMLRVGQ
jgi:hypothetical protein